MGKEGKKGGEEVIEEEKKQFKKIPALETKLLHNTLKHRREHKTHYVIS